MKPINLLWTGGWDSTFRLVQLMIESDVAVQPIYLVDDRRSSAPKEITQMWRIRDKLAELVPASEERILPTEYGSFRATRIEPHFHDAWEEVKKLGRVGSQYPILASFAEQRGIDRLELGIQKHRADGFSIAGMLSPFLEGIETPAGVSSGLPENVPYPFNLFARFVLPLVDLTKHDMRRLCRRWEMEAVMDLTWFCFDPVLGRPCGACQPCRVAISEGFGGRVGLLGPAIRKGSEMIGRVRPRKRFSRLRHALTA